MKLQNQKKKKLSPAPVHWIMLSFFSAILLGSLLLSLPVSAAGGRAVHRPGGAAERADRIRTGRKRRFGLD